MTVPNDFEILCKPTSVADLTRLTHRLSTHVDLVAESALTDPTLPVELAIALADRLGQLARNAGPLSAEQRSWVRGAIHYFLLTGDVNNDVAGPHGLDDDRDVFNEVCRRLGRADLVIN